MGIMNAFDGLVNVLTGRGTSIDRSQHGFWHHVPMPAQQIEAAYRSSWLISKIVDLPPMDMVREWREWELDGDQVKAIEAEEKRLKVIDNILTGLVYGRLGGGVVILGTNGDMAEPVRDGETLLYVKAFPRSVMSLGPWDWDIGSPSFGEPSWFTLRGQNGGDRIHPDRIIVFKGERVPDITGTYTEDAFWGDSIIERVNQAVKNADTAADGFAGLIDEAKVDVYRLAGLADLLLQPNGEAVLRTRVEATNTGKSNLRGVYLDKDDEWEQRQITWSGMPEIIRSYLSIVAGAADIPATRLLGKAPDGQNATGEHDEKNYRGMIATRQNMTLRPALEKLDRLLLPSLQIEADAYWTFSPLDTPSEKEVAEIDKSKAETAQIYANTGLVPMAALEKGVQNRLVEDGTFPGLAEALEELPDMLGNPDDPDPSVLVEKGGGQTVSAGEGGSRLEAEAARRAANDAVPQPLNVQRKLLNAADVIAWAKAQGFESTLPADDMHVTVLYSRTPVDPLEMGETWSSEEDGGLIIKSGGPRALERFNEGAVVLQFASWSLESRHREMIERGASHDWPEYLPHITLTYSAPEDMEIEKIVPYSGALRFGPELFEPLDLDWKAGVSEE